MYISASISEGQRAVYVQITTSDINYLRSLYRAMVRSAKAEHIAINMVAHGENALGDYMILFSLRGIRYEKVKRALTRHFKVKQWEAVELAHL